MVFNNQTFFKNKINNFRVLILSLNFKLNMHFHHAKKQKNTHNLNFNLDKHVDKTTLVDLLKNKIDNLYYVTKSKLLSN